MPPILSVSALAAQAGYRDNALCIYLLNVRHLPCRADRSASLKLTRRFAALWRMHTKRMADIISTCRR